MCGINGYISPEGNIARMNQLLSHRGPDYTGTWQDGNVAIGHCLLAIREEADLSHQPVATRDSPWVLAFNGQLYNTAQIKKELGEKYRTASLDTALLYALIQKHGWDFVRYIHGMYAIALYNTTTRELRLYRDPSGQKILYYYNKNGNFIFSSELKALFSHPIDRHTDAAAVALAVTLGYIPGPKTLCTHIKKLRPGEFVSYCVGSGELHSSFVETALERHYPDDLDEAFALLVTEHLQSKKSIAINLSGGLDSSILAYEMHKQGYPIHSYTTRFLSSETEYNEDADLAARLAKDLGTDHTEILITPEIYRTNMVESYLAVEEPNYNVSLPVYFETARREGREGDRHRVVLSGDGGDELFGGYSLYTAAHRAAHLSRLMTPWLFNAIKRYRNHTHYNYLNPAEFWLSQRTMPLRHIQHDTTVLGKYFSEEVVEQFLPRYKARSDFEYLMMLVDRAGWLAAENFIRSDKLYMHHSMEMRCPLSYHPFREHIDRLIPAGEYAAEGSNKRFLRRQYEGKLPDYIVKCQKKTGWRAPVSIWWNDSLKKDWLSILNPLGKRESLIDWKGVIQQVEKAERWPGKQMHTFISLAILSENYKLNL